MNRFALIGLLLTAFFIEGQGQITRYVLWITPTGKNNVIIDGLALGIMAQPASPEGSLRINGINVEVLPLAVFTMPGSMVLTMLNVPEGNLYAEAPERSNSVIHGVSISGGMFEQVEMHGLSLNLINSYVGFSYGTEMSFVMNSNYSFSGSQLSGWGNRAVEGHGLQFGLFNSCQSGRVVQIGMFNRIGNRVLPLINFDLRKKSGRDRRQSKMKR